MPGDDHVNVQISDAVGHADPAADVAVEGPWYDVVEGDVPGE